MSREQSETSLYKPFLTFPVHIIYYRQVLKKYSKIVKKLAQLRASLNITVQRLGEEGTPGAEARTRRSPLGSQT